MQESTEVTDTRSTAEGMETNPVVPASSGVGPADAPSPEDGSQPGSPSADSVSMKDGPAVQTETVARPRRRRPRAAASRKTPAAVSPSPPEVDLEDPALYLNRELTWLEFNRRVLNEAEDGRTPLLERVKFLAIVSSNLDEFFMKRIGGLKQQVGAGVQKLTVDGRTPQQQIDEAQAVVSEIESRKERLIPEVLSRLAEHGIEVVDYSDLKEEERDTLRKHYIENIMPLVTPQSIDPAHPFPFISNLSLNLLVTLNYKEEESTTARVKVPIGAGLPRFVRIGGGDRFVPLEQVISSNLDLLFPRMNIESCEPFYVTRNANLARESDCRRRPARDDRVRGARAPLRAHRSGEDPAGHGSLPPRLARSRARTGPGQRRLRVGVHARHAAPVSSWRPWSSRRCAIPPATPSTTARWSTSAASSMRSATRARSFSSTHMSRSPTRWSASCARRAAIRRCARSR